MLEEGRKNDMTVVRELVTKLGFQFDRSNLDKFEKAIVGFKTKVGISLGVIGGLVKKSVDFLSGISTAAVKTKDIADYAGISVEELVAMQNAAHKLSLPKDTFSAGIQQLSVDLKEAYYGFGRLHDIARESGGAVNFRGVNGELKDVKTVLLELFDFINSIQDAQRKQFVTGNIFGIQDAGAWLRVIEEGKDKFLQLVESQREFGIGFNESLPSMIKFNRELDSLNEELDQLIFTLSKFAVPIVGQTVKGFNEIIAAEKNEAGSGIGGALKEFAFSLGEIFLSEEEAQNAKNQRLNRLHNSDSEEFNRKLSEEYNRLGIQNSASVVNNNRFEFNVPLGTSEDQATFMTEQVKMTIENMWNEKTREVISNNPQVEGRANQ